MRFRVAIVKVGIALGVSVGSVLLSATGAAAADNVTVTPEHPAYNADVTVNAGGFAPNSKVDLFNDGTVLQSATADGNGNASAVFKPGGLGASTREVRLVGKTPSGAPRGPVGVYTSSPCVAGNGVTCQSLPQTGALPYAGLALFVLVIGIIGLRFRREVGIGGTLALLLIVGVAAVWQQQRPSSAASTASISGQVTDVSSQAGLPDICVHAVAPSNSFGSARTDASGNYTVTGLDAGTYEVTFIDCSTVPLYGRDTSSVQVADAAALTGQNKALTKQAVLAGTVADGAGAAVPGCVWLGTGPDAMQCVIYTGDSGAFFSDPLDPGSYFAALVPQAAERAITYFGGKNQAPGSTQVNPTAGSMRTDVNFAVPNGASVQGKVLDDATNAPPTRSVCVHDISGDQLTLASAFAGQDGTFTIDQLGPGAHKVKFVDCDSQASGKYVTQFYAQKADVASADPVPLTSDQTKTGIDARLSPTGVPSGGGSNSTTTTSTAVAGGATTTTTVDGGTTTTTAGSAPVKRTPDGTATSSAVAVAPGGSLTVAGSGFKPGSSVAVDLFSTPRVLATVSANSAGAVSATVTIPADIEPGTHEIQLQGVDPAGAPRTLSRTITVGKLSRTGGGFVFLWPLAAVLVLLGAAGMFAGRRNKLGTHYSS